jgi:aryl-alcohol dehydrogenase-like predicted oxidoreductase
MATFGRTGHLSSRVIFGGAALAEVTQAVADRTLVVLLEHGVNHIEVAAGYGERRAPLPPWLRREPDRFFVATKTGKRTAAEPARSCTGRWTGWASTRWTSGSCTPWPTRSSGTWRSAPAARSRRPSRRGSRGWSAGSG